jgi:glutaredoxin
MALSVWPDSGRPSGHFLSPPASINMKTMVKLFFKTLRLVLGPFMRLWELISRPKGIVRASLLQAEVDQQCSSLVLYQFTTCPFCIKVRQEMRRLSLNIERRDAQKDAKNRADLIEGVGQPKVPCLKITDSTGNSQWLVESGEIISYLRGRFANG